MSRPRLSLVAALAAASFSAAATAAAEDPPNVVLIVADDLGWADLGCYGSKFHKTPNLDKMAAEGRRFTHAYAPCHVCSPTRAALMTGKHPARLNLTDWLPGRPDRPDQKLNRPTIRQELPLEEVTLAEAFKEAGYATGHFGKWHLGGDGFGPKEQGFDVNVAGDSRGSPPGYHAPYSFRGKTPVGLETAAEGEYLTDRLADEAVKFIEANRGRPFFVYLPQFAVHTPMQAKEEYLDHYPKWDGTPHGRQENPIYATMLESVDDGVGKIFRTLKAVGIDEKTVVVFTSDNGGLATREGPNTPATNNSPLREGKGWFYEGGLRVPLIVRWPGKVDPGVDPAPVGLVDVYPTLLDLAGLKLPEVRDGLSLAGHLTGGTPVGPRELYWHYPHYSNQGGSPGGAVRDATHKLIEFYENGRHELFDVRDASESRNLAEAMPEKVEELAAKLDAWRRSVGAKMPTPNPEFVPNPQAPNGKISLPARTAEVHGLMLRYEPLPHKNTLGFWVRKDDWASWEFEVKNPGTFEVTALVGCGNGSGGSAVDFDFGGETLSLTVPVTGGFQAFQPQKLGRVTIKEPGRHRLEVRPRSKPGLAVMDLRQVELVPAGD